MALVDNDARPGRPPRALAMMMGGAGGACVPLVKLVAAGAATTAAAAAHGPSLPEIVEVLPAAALLGFLGAVVAAAVGAETLLAALLLGASAPGYLTSAFNGVASVQETTPPARTPAGVVRSGAVWSLVTTARAEEAAPAAPPPIAADPTSPDGPGRSTPVQVVVEPQIVGGLPKATSLPVGAERPAAGGGTEKIPLGAVDAAAGPTAITLPPGTERLTVGGSTLAVPQGSSDGRRVGVTVTTVPTPGSDFYWALGGRRDFQVRSIDAKLF